VGLAVTFGDFLQTVRCVSRFEASQRAQACQMLLRQATDAQHYLSITGQVHPFYGDGSLGAACLRLGHLGLPARLDKDELETIRLVATQLLKQGN